MSAQRSGPFSHADSPRIQDNDDGAFTGHIKLLAPEGEWSVFEEVRSWRVHTAMIGSTCLIQIPHRALPYVAQIPCAFQTDTLTVGPLCTSCHGFELSLNLSVN